MNVPETSRAHGTISAYNDGCACDDCRAAHAAYARVNRQRVLADDDERHGTVNAYVNFGCKCGPCRHAMASYKSEARRKGNTPTAIQADFRAQLRARIAAKRAAS